MVIWESVSNNTWSETSSIFILSFDGGGGRRVLWCAPHCWAYLQFCSHVSALPCQPELKQVSWLPVERCYDTVGCLRVIHNAWRTHVLGFDPCSFDACLNCNSIGLMNASPCSLTQPCTKPLILCLLTPSCTASTCTAWQQYAPLLFCKRHQLFRGPAWLYCPSASISYAKIVFFETWTNFFPVGLQFNGSLSLLPINPITVRKFVHLISFLYWKCVQ